MEWIEAKSLLSAWKEGENWFGWNYTMNLYRGCCHGCIYCDSRCDCYRIEDFDRVRAKKDAIPLLTAELQAKRKKGVIGMGSMSDPYNPLEETLRLTRQALERIARYGFGVGVATKSDRIARDVNCYVEIARRMPVIAKMTVTCGNDALASRLEPNAPPPTRRWAAVEALARSGIFTGILLMPVLPWITDAWENIESIVARAADAGARFVYPGFGVTLRMNQKAYFYQEVEKRYPGMARRYAEVYGPESHCICPDAETLWQRFEEVCQAKGLLCRMEDILAESRRPYRQEQIRMDEW